MLAHYGDRLRKGRLGFAIPHRLPDWQRVLLRPLSGPQRHHREHPQQGRGGADDGQLVPLPLRLQAQMRTGLLPGYLQAPPQHKPLQDLDGFHWQVRTQQGWRFELLLGVAHQDPAHGQWGHSRVIPHGSSQNELHVPLPFAIPPVHLRRRPLSGQVGQDLGQSGQAIAFEAWPAILAWLQTF